MTINAAQILRDGALRHPDRVATVTRDAHGGRVEHTYGALDLAARRVAARLPAGARVAILADNGPACVAAWFGAARAACPVVPLPTSAAVAELVVRLDHARVAAVLVDPAHRDLAAAAAAGAARPPALLDPADLAAAGAGADRDVPPAPTRPDDPALILYTSGTTGAARGAVISHGALVLHTAALVHHTLRLGADDRVLGVLPLSHSYGCRMVMLASFFAGARCVLTPRFSARDSLAVSRAEGVTWIPAVPTMFAAWAAAPPGPVLPTLRWCLSAGAPLPDGVRAGAEARLGAEIRGGYGMTEASFATVDAPPAAATPGSVGRPVWGVEVRVVDGHGVDVSPGAEGELLLRGPNQMLGYLDDDRATAAAHRDGWVRSGDLGRVDAGGRVWVVDRLKDIILRGGHTLYPAEIEDALCAHPGVSEAAVVGRPDAFYGEEVVAVVVPRAGARPTLAALREHLADRLAEHKRPRALALVDTLPLGPSRKVLKRTLRAWLADGTLPVEPG